MAENQDNVTPSTADGQAAAAPAPGQPTGFQVPDGHRLVRDSDYTTLETTARRNAERVNGMQSLFQAARNAGFNSPDDFAKYVQRMQGLQRRGLDLDRIESMFSGEDDDSSRPSQNAITMEDIEKKIALAKTEWQREQAMNEYRKLRDSEDGIIGSWRDEVLGQDAPDAWKDLLGHAARGILESNRGLLPEDHPLASDVLAYYDKDSSQAHLAKLAELYKSVNGGMLASIGDAANKKIMATGSKPGGQGAASPPQRDGRGGRRMPPRQEVEAEFRRLQAARGQPASQQVPGV